MQSRILDRVGSRRAILALPMILLGLLLTLWGCGGGGGGGGGSSQVPVTGRVLQAETGLPPNPNATVTIGGSTATTTADGKFTLNASSKSTSATIAASGAQTRTLPIALVANQTNNLGDIFLSNTGYNATVTGRVVAQVSGQLQPVGNATVTIAGASTKTATDGTFTLSNLPVGLGNASGTVGKVSAQGFEDKPITDITLGFPLAAGNNPIGDLLIAAPSGTVPLPPYTITGVVQVKGTATKNLTVSLISNGNNLGSTTTDSNGAYFFWVVPGTYTVMASNTSGGTQTTNVTLTKLDTPVTAPVINFP